MNRYSVMSACKTYRYQLHRSWDDSLPTVCYVLLNPSTADATVDDPTVLRCVERAKRLGFGSLSMVNLFSFRATKPIQMMRSKVDPIGVHTDSYITEAAEQAKMIICGWSKHGHFLGRHDYVLRFVLRPFVKKCYALRMNKDNTPSHPLYLPYDIQPFLLVHFCSELITQMER